MQLLLNERTKTQLDKTTADPKGAYIFSGPQGIGKYSATLQMAKILNCKDGSGNDRCSTCLAIEHHNFADLLVVDSGDKDSIGIAQIQELQVVLRLKNFHANSWRIAIIKKADLLTEEAQNSLLKILEETPPRTIIILLCNEIESLLSTIISRCQLIRFQPIPTDEMAAYLKNTGMEADLSQDLAEFSQGCVGRAIYLARDHSRVEAYRKLRSFIDQLLGSDLYSRMLLATKLNESDLDTGLLVELVARRLQTDMRNATEWEEIETAAKGIKAIERFHRYISSNVNPRAALEGLMLEL